MQILLTLQIIYALLAPFVMLPQHKLIYHPSKFSAEDATRPRLA